MMKKSTLTTIYFLIQLSMATNAQSRLETIKTNESTLDSMKIEINNIRNTIEQVKIEVSELQNRNKEFELKIDNHIQLQNAFTGNLSNQLDIINCGVTIWGIIFGVLGVLLAAYITYMQYITRHLLTKTEQVKKDVELIQTDINSNLNLIFNQLNQKEIDYILNRLRNVPEDIEHLFSPLASKKVESKYFYEFKDLALSLDQIKYKDTISKLVTLIVQHFPNRIVFDDDLFEALKKNWAGISSAFYEEEIKLLLLSYVEKINQNGVNQNDLKIFMTNLNVLHPRLTAESLYDNLKSKSLKNEMSIFFKANNLLNIDAIFSEKYKNEYT